LYPELSSIADRIITDYPKTTINAMRLFVLNGTMGTSTLIQGGLGYEFVTFRFTGMSIGRGFDFRLELYENYGNFGSSKKASMILIILLCIVYSLNSFSK